jgi:hypothetical protein
MRNALQCALAAHFRRTDWWASPQARLHRLTARKIDEAEQELRRRGKIPDPNRIVAELSMGFWVSLLGPGNEYETRLWRPALHSAFRGYRGKRKGLHRDFDHVRTFRNRVAHHEPIYHRHLAADHDTIMRLAGYISGSYAAWMRQHDRVPEVLAYRGDVCAGALAASF